MRFSARMRWIIRQVVNVGVIVFLSALLKMGMDYLDIVANQTSTGAEINMRIPWAGIPAGIGSILAIYVLELADAVLSLWTGRQFSVKEAREEDIHRALRGDHALRGEVAPPAPVEASPLEAD
jgi:TRAP-type C4-dicarboxylate transport system permease small subunit